VHHTIPTVTEIRLAYGGTLAGCVEVLTQRAAFARNMVATCATQHPRDAADDYFSWAADSFKYISRQLERERVERLIFTAHYWSLRASDGMLNAGSARIREELEDRAAALEELAIEAANLDRRWSVGGSIAVPDTNVFLHNALEFHKIDWPTELDSRGDVRIVVPAAVLRELDKHKRGERRNRARITLRELEQRLAPNPERFVMLRERDVHQRATTLEALLDPLDHRTLPDADSEIVERALYLKELSGRQVTVATSDTTMRFMALAQGLAVAGLSEAER
jgi:rRNA-processing protein FCF1